ncbi:MAG: SpoIVB peptidase [Velocimicrobium sp.]
MKRDRKRQYKKILCFALGFNILTIVTTYFWFVETRIPNEIVLFVGEEESLDFGTPVVGVFSGNNPSIDGNVHFDFTNPVSLTIDNTGSYAMKLQLFGLFHLKNIALNVVDTQCVIPGGENIGIYVQTKGVMVLGDGTVTGIDGMKYDPAQNIIKTGDYITAINGVKVSDIEDMLAAVKENGNKKITLDLVRDKEKQAVSIMPVETNNGEYKLGIWVRDDTQGVGTLTYRTTNGEFGALGHGITDSDTGLIMEIDKGNIFEAEIIDIVKGAKGKPGELVGVIRSQETMRIGDVNQNTECGIFGTIKENNKILKEKEAISIGLKQEVKKGKASILCQLDGKVEEYAIEIEKIKWNSTADSKGMILKITDTRLLDKTNGIIQGMSGSPILQNGKLIGAVTHVFIQDSTKGYGIFIENMLKK